MSETANTSYPNSDAAIQIYYVIWALFAILVVLLPCYIFPRKRALCFKRIRERRWNVSIEDHQIGSVLEGNLRPRYPPGDPRHVVTKEESEKSKRDFIYKRLQNFTKTLQESDFATKNAADFGEAVKEANHRRQSILGNLGHTSTSSISSTIATSPDRQQQQRQQKKRTFNSVVSTMFSTWNGNDNDHGHDVRMDDLQQDGKDANVQQDDGGSIPVLDIPVKEAVVVAVSQEDAAEQGGSRIETSCSSIPLQDETFVEDQQQILRRDNHHDEEDEEEKEKVQDHLIRVLKLPCPGQQLVEDNPAVTKCDNDGDDDEIPNNQGQDSTQTNFREIIPECCICLNDFKSGDVISWSPQHQCSHSFHEECIVKWFLTLCERSEARRARRMNGVGCNLQCPVCRQDFISLSETFPQSDVLHEEQV